MDFFPLIVRPMENDFAKPSLDLAREHITALLETYRIATGLSPTFIAILARGGDPKFARHYLTKDFGFRSYDAVNSRLSAVWPEGTAWPEHVPRQAPAKIEDQLLTELHKRLNRLAATAGETQKEESHG